MLKPDGAEVPPSEHLGAGEVDYEDDHTIDRDTLERLRAERAAVQDASPEADASDDDDDDDRTIDRASLDRLRAAAAQAAAAGAPAPNADGSEHDGLTIDRATMDRIRDVEDAAGRVLAQPDSAPTAGVPADRGELTIDQATSDRSRDIAAAVSLTPMSARPAEAEAEPYSDTDDHDLTIDRAALDRLRSRAAVVKSARDAASHAPHADEQDDALEDDEVVPTPIAVESAVSPDDVTAGLPDDVETADRGEVDVALRLRRRDLRRDADVPDVEEPHEPVPVRTGGIPLSRLATAEVATTPASAHTAATQTDSLTQHDVDAPRSPRVAPAAAPRPRGTRPPGARGAREAGRRRTRRIILFSVLGGLALVIAIGVGALATVIHTQAGQIQTIPHELVFPGEDPPRTEAGGAAARTAAGMNILLLGTDSTDDLSALAQHGGDRSDTMMIVNLAGDGDAVSVMSIKRDTWVMVPEYGQAKINAALSVGGAPLAVQTVEAYFGIPIDHIAVLDVDGLNALTDALGGVSVDNPTTFTSSHEDGVTFQRGTVELDGETALAYLRERDAFSDGDGTRVRNQQAFMAGVLDKLTSLGLFADPAALTRIVGSLQPDLIVDSGLDTGLMLSIAQQFAAAGSTDTHFFTAPTTQQVTGGETVAFLDEDEWQDIRRAFVTDTVAEYAQSR